MVLVGHILNKALEAPGGYEQFLLLPSLFLMSQTSGHGSGQEATSLQLFHSNRDWPQPNSQPQASVKSYPNPVL